MANPDQIGIRLLTPWYCGGLINVSKPTSTAPGWTQADAYSWSIWSVGRSYDIITGRRSPVYESYPSKAVIDTWRGALVLHLHAMPCHDSLPPCDCCNAFESSTGRILQEAHFESVYPPRIVSTLLLISLLSKPITFFFWIRRIARSVHLAILAISMSLNGLSLIMCLICVYWVGESRGAMSLKNPVKL